MKIVDAYPPNIDKIAAALPGARRKGVMFSYGPTIYAPHGVRVSPALKAHEAVHGERQIEIGIEEWWDRYIADKEFRFAEELIAHQAEYRWFVKHQRHRRMEMGPMIARRLSSALYGSVISYPDALMKIEVQPG